MDDIIEEMIVDTDVDELNERIDMATQSILQVLLSDDDFYKSISECKGNKDKIKEFLLLYQNDINALVVYSFTGDRDLSFTIKKGGERIYAKDLIVFNKTIDILERENGEDNE